MGPGAPKKAADDSNCSSSEDEFDYHGILLPSDDDKGGFSSSGDEYEPTYDDGSLHQLLPARRT